MKANTAKITRIALGVAFVTVGAQLAYPSIPPITLQTLCIFIMSTILAPNEAFIMSLVYILLGAIGVPVFSSFSGGIGVIRGLGGGFILSFPIISYLISLASKKLKSTTLTYAISFGVATAISYVFGALWISIFELYDGTLSKMLSAVVLPFIPFDIIKIAIAVICTKKLKGIFKNDKKNQTNQVR